jgi:hypothetical protein
MVGRRPAYGCRSPSLPPFFSELPLFPIDTAGLLAVVLLPTMGCFVAKTGRNDPGGECQRDDFRRVIGGVARAGNCGETAGGSEACLQQGEWLL